MQWGNNTLVYKSTLIDLKTGKTSKAPWGSSNSALIVGDTAIFCKESDAYRLGCGQETGSGMRTIAGRKTFDSLDHTVMTFLVRDNQRYLALLNAIDTIAERPGSSAEA